MSTISAAMGEAATKRRLEALGYTDALHPGNVPLVDKLLGDLVHTTESYRTLKLQCARLAAERDGGEKERAGLASRCAGAVRVCVHACVRVCMRVRAHLHAAAYARAAHAHLHATAHVPTPACMRTCTPP